MSDTQRKWIDTLQEALSVGKRLVNNPDEFNRCCGHIVGLLIDAVLLYKNNSNNTAVFLAITAMEEIGKVNIGIYRNGTDSVDRKGDPLYSHGKKLNLATGPTVGMGTRITDAIGTKRIQELQGNAQNGKMVKLRESALYIECRDGKLMIPDEIVTKAMARELLLLAIESFDDGLVGYTELSKDIAKRTDDLFKEVCELG